jgi:hypothetical protein
VDALPAGALGLAGALARDSVTGALLDSHQLLDVDVDQLAGIGPLVAVGRLRWLQATELAKADPVQHRRDRGARHLEQLGDLGTGHSQAT